jgi:hypothetical protein
MPWTPTIFLHVFLGESVDRKHTPIKQSERLTGKEFRVFLHVSEHKEIGIDYDELATKDLDSGSDVEVLRTIIERPFRRRTWLAHAASLEKLAADNTRVLGGRFKDREHVVVKTIRDNESSTILLGCV